MINMSQLVESVIFMMYSLIFTPTMTIKRQKKILKSLDYMSVVRMEEVI